MDDVIYDEDLVPAYTLPDPLERADGSRLTSASEWPARRAELLEQFEREMFGRTRRQDLGISRAELLEEGEALEGSARRKQVRLWFQNEKGSAHIDLLLYRPRASVKAPVFLGLNFGGNHTVQPDAQIRLPISWVADWGKGTQDNRATDEGRGTNIGHWPVRKLIERGYALATAYYGDIDPDYDDGFQNGIHPLFYAPGQSKPLANEWGSIGAWAWGLSRLLDFLEGEAGIDARRAAVMGHSRLGKAALWAGAQDERFGLVVSNDSGCGGAALSRRRFGESVRMINERFPHWFCANFKQYNILEDHLPFDQHELVALIAPRAVYIASAVEDLWADPKGEFLAGKHGSPVYRLLGVKGLEAEEMPEVGQPVMGGKVGYHVRPGGHDVTDYDWERYLDFADRNM
jgi:hypothetical protein